MKFQSVHLQFELTRYQRLIPHLKLWGVTGPSYLFFLFASILASLNQSTWYILVALILAWFCRNYIVGLINIIFQPKCEVDIVIEPLGIGFLIGDQRWWVHMDGILAIQKLTTSVWTVSHHNGTVINVPTDSMPEECVAHIQAAIEGKWAYLQSYADEHRKKLELQNKSKLRSSVP